ncbi:MAG: sigma-70 family RNA polymerase sigma factor, partial [Acidobacteriota bacterium]
MGTEAVAAGRVLRAERAGSAGYPPAEGEAAALTAEQERVLLEHLPIVRFLARRIHERLPQHVEIEDLISAGIVGLMDAFAKFDPAKKVQFRSYA